MNSIRVKLLLVSGSLLMLLGVFLIGYNRNAFIKDKNVYLFDSLSEKRQWDQEQVGHTIKDIKQKMDWVAYQYSIQQPLALSIKQFIQDRDWGQFEVYVPDESQLWMVKESLPSPLPTSTLSSQFWHQHPLGIKFQMLNLSQVRVTYKAGGFGIYGLVKFPLGREWQQQPQRYIYQKSKGMSLDKDNSKPQQDQIYSYFGQSAQGVREVSWQQRPYLLSLTLIDDLDLVIIDLVDKNFVMASVKKVVNRTAALGGAILILGLLVLTLLTTQLTSNINRLVNSMLLFSTKGEAPQVAITSQDEIGKMAMIYNQMLLKIKQLLVLAVEQTRMQGELNTAKEVQATLLPKAKWNNDYYTVKGYYQPASECGGDIWFVHQYPEGVVVFVGDATGHGVSAALITAAVRSVLSVCVEQSNWDPGSILTLVNRVLCDMAKGTKMMTAFAVNYNQSSHQLFYANASHDIPVVIPPRKEGHKVTKKDLIFITENKKRRLGDKLDEAYVSHKMELELGSTLLIYTDGVVDAQNKVQESWGERRLMKLMVDLGSRGLGKNIFDRLSQSLEEFTAQQEQPDDITFVALTLKNPHD